MSSANTQNAKGMVITGVLGSQAVDKSGEVLDVKTADISSLLEGKGFVNFEHKLPAKYKPEQTPEPDTAMEIVGKIVYAKKILKEDDCEDSLQREFWQKLKIPFIFGAVRLFDAAGHEHAKAIAAAVRDAVANNEPLEIGFSVEGAVLTRDGVLLKDSVVRGVAMTIKPCNATAKAKLIADPEAPEGFVVEPYGKSFYKSEATLGGTVSIYSGGLLKAMSAGSYDAAPATLTGGAALQRESIHKATAKAAYRDYPRGSRVKFRDFLKKYFEKSGVSDVSDEFIDHYSDLVEAKYWRMAKREEVLALRKDDKPEPDLKSPPKGLWQFNKETGMVHHAHRPEIAFRPGKKKATNDAPKAAVVKTPLTNNGVALKPNKKIDSPVFDPRNGLLHMPEGTLKVYVPSHDTPENAKAFSDIMSDPKVEQFHGYAMENWVKAHQLLKAGKLPPEVAMHSVLFSNLSPNTPVPVQELMYGHLVDSMGSTGKTPLHSDWSDVEKDWNSRDSATRFPDHSPEHWRRLEDSLRLKMDSKNTGRSAGDISSFMLARNKFANMSKYRDMHGGLMEMLGRYKHNSRAMAEEMMFHHYEKGKWDSRRSTRLKAGHPDIGPYPHFPISGLAPKTSRYALGMMGGGNVVVPDTHFVRNLFGLNREQDGATIDRVKDYLWNSKHTHLLNGIDQYYANNHDAVKLLLQHPTWGKYFEKPEDAIFPAFWKHWMGIVPHEKHRGHQINGYNELTDHRPFWEAVGPYLNKSETNESLPMRTARQHAQWVQEYGEHGAAMLYFRYLLPELLGAAAGREATDLMIKAQSLQVEMALEKADPNTPKTDTKPKRTINYAGRKIEPGLALVFPSDALASAKKFHLLHSTASEFHALPADKHSPHEPTWTHNDVVRIPRSQEGLKVKAFPTSVDTPAVVDADKHGLGLFTPQARELAHGFDFSRRSDYVGGDPGIAERAGQAFWAKGPRGQDVYAKGTLNDRRSGVMPGWNEASREAAYADIAHSLFGMGNYVPNVAHVAHPQTGQEFALIEHVPGEDGADLALQARLKPWLNNRPSDEIHKLGLMNTILLNVDRHSGNFRIDTEGNKLTLIDHNLWGDGRNFSAFTNIPEYVTGYHAAQSLSPETKSWLAGIDPTNLTAHLQKHHVPSEDIERSVAVLKNLQAEATHPVRGEADFGSLLSRAKEPDNGVVWQPDDEDDDY